MPYNARDYWEAAHARNDLASVGQSDYSAEWNRWLYRTWLRNGLEFLREESVTADRVCDVGAGRGSWFPVWRAIGSSHITAIDMVGAAVDRLADVEAHERDIAKTGAVVGMGTFDLVAAMWVLLHITDDARFGAAMDNLAALTRPGGYLLVGDAIAKTTPPPSHPEATSVRRPLAAFCRPGLDLVALRAATVITSDPVDHRGLLARGFFGVTSRAGSRLPWLLGPIVSQSDHWLWRHTGWMPTAKLALFRKGVKSRDVV